MLDEPGIPEHVLIELLLDAGDRLDAAGHHHWDAIDDHPLGGDGDRLQPGGAEAVHGGARRRDGQARPQRDLAGDIAACGALGERAPHDDVLDLGGVEAGPLHGRADDVGAERRAVRQVQGAAPGLRQARAGGGDDRCVGHGALPLNDLPSGASFARSGAGSHAAGSPCGFLASRRMDRATL